MPHPLNVVNSLVRIDGISSTPRKPFERPNSQMDFWVLELSLPADASFSDWCQKSLKTLHRHRTTLSRLREQGARLTLFLQTEGYHGVLRFESSFVQSLADMRIALEHHHYAEDA